MASVPTGDLRVSDAERERAVAELGPHYAEGRLTLEEYTARLDEAWAARTGHELGRVLRELPAARPPAPAGHHRGRAGAGLGALAHGPWLVVALVAAVALVVATRGWLLWPLAFVGLGWLKSGRAVGGTGAWRWRRASSRAG